MTQVIIIAMAIWYICHLIKIAAEARSPLIKKVNRRQNDLFNNSYIESNSFYLEQFGNPPAISFINNIEPGKVYDYLKQGYAGKLLCTYQRNYYNWQHNRQEYSRNIFVPENKMMIELGNDYAEILYPAYNYGLANALINIFVNYKTEGKEGEYSINIITLNHNGLELKKLDITPTPPDLGLYYNDDFAAVNKIITERLAKENDKGIILLHGLPGTGKTTYLRYLVGTIKKKVLFVSPAVAGNLMNPEFIDLLIDNPNAVLIIEDAENIIMDRKFSINSSVSNLLNLSDGLLSDCLNVQIICTFNSPLAMIDTALMRKGRLIARYEFKKLTVEKGQQLAAELDVRQLISCPMTLAEITNADQREFEAGKIEVMGFRRKELQMN